MAGLVLLLLASACTSHSASTAQPGQDASASGSAAPGTTTETTPAGPSSWGGEACRQATVTCQTYAGLPTAIVARNAGTVADVVLVDLGGPGASVEQTIDSLTDVGLLAGHDVLIVGEAWEVSAPSAACLDSEAARIRSWSTLAGASCDLAAWQFSAEHYRQAVDQALAAKSAHLTAAVGVSFGAVRVSAGTSATVPLLLVSPAPLQLRSAELVTTRAAAMQRQALLACAGAPACSAVLKRLGTQVTGDDDYRMALALIGAARDAATFDATVKSLSDHPAAEVKGDQERQAFAATFRYGDGAVLPNLLSYRAGTCGFYGSDSATEHGLAQVLTSILACPPGAAVSSAAAIDLHRRTGCVLSAGADLVTPPAFAKDWIAPQSSLHLVAAGVSAHGVLDGRATTLITGLPGSLRSC